METRVTSQRNRGLPPIDEIEKIVSILCQRCGFRTEHVILQIIGGDHLGEHKGVGVRIMKPNQFSVYMFVGCKENTAEVHFILKNPAENNRAVSSQHVYNEMVKVCDPSDTKRRVFRVTDDMIREYERKEREKRATKENGANGNGHHGTRYRVTSHFAAPPALANRSNGSVGVIEAPAPATLVESSTVAEAPEQASVGQTDTAPVATAESAPEPPAPPKHYERHFDDPVKLHLTAVALASIVDGSTAKPFNLKEFATALEQSKVPEEAGIPQSILYKFMRYGFLVRINPDGDRGVYNVTDALIQFASAPVPLELPPFAKSDNSGNADASVKPAPASKQAKPAAVKETLASLKQEEARYHGLLDAKRKVIKALEDLEKQDFDGTEGRVQGEIKSLEKRISALKDDLVRIDIGRKDIRAAKSKLGDLERDLADPALAAALSELAEFRKMLS